MDWLKPELVTAFGVLITAAGGVMAGVFRAWKHSMDAHLEEQRQTFMHMQAQIEAQQKTIVFLSNQVGELEKARAKEFADTEELRKETAQLREESAQMREELAALRRWGKEVLTILEAAKIAPPEPPLALKEERARVRKRKGADRNDAGKQGI